MLFYRNFEKGFESLKEIVKIEGVESATNAFDLLMNSYCENCPRLRFPPLIDCFIDAQGNYYLKGSI